MISSIFLNMPITNLARSVDFFTALGFTFDAQFTDETSTCMIIGPNMHAMLCEQEKFKGFIDKPMADRATSEVIFSLSCDSSGDVNRIALAAFEQGARKINEPEDRGFMYSWAFEDLDGHLWDLFWMNPEHVQ